MKKYAKFLALILVAAMAVGLTGCGKTDDQKNKTGDGSKSVTVGVVDLVSDFSPWSASNTGRLTALSINYQPICERNKFTGELELVLAKSIEQLDEVTYRVTLYDNIVDVLGNPFTASDVVFSIEGCREAGQVVAVQYIKGAEVVSDYVVDIVMNTSAFFQFGAAVSQVYMVTEASYNATENLGESPIGTGPYASEDYVPGSHWTAKAREDYWGADLADESVSNGWFWHAQNVEEITYQLVAESSQMSIALETGVIDIAQNLSSDEASRFEGVEGYTTWEVNDVLTYVVCYNQDPAESPCADENLRKAIAYAIDAEAIMEGVGGNKVLAHTLGASTFSDFLEELAGEDYYGYDPEKAAEYLAASDYDGTTPLRLLVQNIAERSSVAQMVAGYLEAIGIQCKIDAYDTATYNTYRFDKTMWDLKIQYRGGECVPDFAIELLSTEARSDGINNSFFYDATLQELIDTTSTTAGHTEENLKALHEYIVDNCYDYALFTGINFSVTRDAIKSYPMTAKFYLFPNACEYDESFFA